MNQKKRILLSCLLASACGLGVAIAQETPLPTTEAPLPADPAAIGSLDGVLESGDELLSADTPAEPEVAEVRYDAFQTATLRALDKITGRSTDIDVAVGLPVVFGSLRVNLQACYQTPPELPPEAAAFLKVDNVQATQVESVAEADTTVAASSAEDRLFSGWMFASSPGLSALEHPVYDIWVIHCTASVPVLGASAE